MALFGLSLQFFLKCLRLSDDGVPVYGLSRFQIKAPLVFIDNTFWGEDLCKKIKGEIVIPGCLEFPVSLQGYIPWFVYANAIVSIPLKRRCHWGGAHGFVIEHNLGIVW